MGDKKKVLVVDDSAFMRRVISDIINNDSRLETVGVATNGKEAIELLDELVPDVISLDIQMPVMDGLTMMKKMKKTHRIPVVMMSTLTREGAKETIQALELGAFDFVAKPDNIFKVNSDEVRSELLEKLYQAALSEGKSQLGFKPKISRTLSSHGRRRSTHKESPWKKRDLKLSVTGSINKIVAIGTSTGGPRALQYLLPFLPADIDAGIVIVQHMPPGFTKSLAERLDQLSEIKVKEAEDGEKILPGVAYIAPGDRHLLVKESGAGYYVELLDGPKKSSHKPAVDVMMTSIAKLKIPHVLGVIMTGMGADGRDGFSDLKKTRQVHIIAQDEESCVVFGMPRSVIEAGLADEIISLEQLPVAIVNKLEVL